MLKSQISPDLEMHYRVVAFSNSFPGEIDCGAAAVGEFEFLSRIKRRDHARSAHGPAGNPLLRQIH